MCERVWRKLKICAIKEVLWLDLATDSQLASRQSGTRVKHAGNWRVQQLVHYRTKCTVWPSSLLATQNHDSFHLRDWVARMPCLDENWLFTFLTYTTINTLIPMKCRKLLERILRKKPYRKTRLTHPQFLSFDSPNSFTLTLSIEISLRATFAKSLPHHTYISEKVF